MGMHFGVVATRGSADELLAALSAYGSFAAGAAIRSFEDAPETDSNGEKVMIAGDDRGSAFLFDPSLLISSSLDLIVDASKRLHRQVMAIGAETVSGTYYLFAATDGKVDRAHWTLLQGLEQPYDVGTPLAGEPEDGLDDVDGRRLAGVLKAAGFDYHRWFELGRKVVVDAAYGEPVAGPAGDALNAYMEAHMAQDGRLDTIVAKRGEGGFDIVVPGTRMPDGSRIARKKGLLGRLFGRS